jgi:ribosomal protein L21
MLREETAGLMAAYDIGSTIEVVNDEGDDQKRSLDLDWLLVLTEKNVDNGRNETRRRVVKCTVEKQGKQWKITALEPIDIFKY